MAKPRQIPGVDCNSNALDSIRPVLLTRLKEMCALRERALDWSDPEGVHDMRVSSRRLRGALSDFAPYLRKRKLANAVKPIRSLADALGDVRDQDVAIIGLTKLKGVASEEAAATVEQFITARNATLKTARKDLRRSLSKTAIKQMEREFAVAVESLSTPSSKRRSKKSKPEPTYIQIGHSIISQRLKEVERLSHAFYDPLKIKPLHRLRIAAKRLRYALELFDQCLGPEASVFAKRVARLQTSLGELHDSDVWIATFGEQLDGAKRQDSQEHIAGSLWLLRHFVRLHSKYLRTALAQWEEWERNDFGNQLRSLLVDHSSEDEASPSSESEPANSQATTNHDKVS